MEIEEMKTLWSEMSDQLEQQKKLTNEIIMNMTQERYTNKFRTISTYETFGALLCLIVFLFILLNLKKLDTWYLMTCGIITLAFISVLPVLTLMLLGKIKNFNIIDKSYKEALIGFQRAKKNLLTLQQFAIYASFIIIFTSSAVFAKIFGNKDFFMIDRGIKEYLVFGFTIAFVFFFSRWGLRAYKKITKSAENVLNEAEDVLNELE